MLNNLKIGTRMLLGYGTVIILLLVVGGYSIVSIRSLNDEISAVVNVRMPNAEKIHKIADNLNVLSIGFRNIIIDTRQEQQTAELEKIANARKTVSEIIEFLQKDLKTEKGKELLQNVIEARKEYVTSTENFMKFIKSQQLNDAKELLLTTVHDAKIRYSDRLNELKTYQTELATSGGKKAEGLASEAVVIISAILIAALVVSIISGITIIRSITSPISKTVTLAEAMARGDFTSELKIDQKDEIGTMATALNKMISQLREMITEIIGGVNTLSSSSSELAAVSKQLTGSAQSSTDKSNMVAAAAEEMSSNFQSVSAAMEQSTSNVNMVASATEEMNVTVTEIGQNAEKARSISENAVKQSSLVSERMTTLGESAKKIGNVTETITEISEQTNLLALNATIEAARAGDAGKGFAVVANEIKELARQTAAATIDIKNQIDEMQHTTQNAVIDIREISNVISEINSVINGIATAVEEQSTATNEISNNISQASMGIGEVNQNVAQSATAVTDITRDISAINQQSKEVREGSSQVQGSAQGLSDLARQLESLVKKFKV
ncbi:MAG: methyl-accepting chemotaxis protein [Desulfocapsaceae bacterium]|nr:methyl-accepting chemotaxis protein [Desulfocapsaceae bacterium]